MLYLGDLVADKLSEIEKIQSQILELVNRSQVDQVRIKNRTQQGKGKREQ